MIQPRGRLVKLASTFVDLRSARESLDYNLHITASYLEADALIGRVEEALHDWGNIQHLPETATFLAAFLVSDRGNRRG